MYLRKKLSILLILLVSVPSSAFADDSAVSLDQNQKAPFSGILITTDQAQTLRKNTLERDDLKLINDSLNNQIKLYQSNETLYEHKSQILYDQNIKLTESLNTSRESGTLEKIGYFALGALATGLVAYGVYRTK